MIEMLTQKIKKDDRVITVVEDRNSHENYEICSRHVVACDGARSKVRETLGIQCEGESTCEIAST
jgi:2-polyprenyl-6-methoxyphenol hydroxylase-like FAD-dependent oxidoreductase